MWIDFILSALTILGIAFVLRRFCRYNRHDERRKTAEYNAADMADKKTRLFS